MEVKSGDIYCLQEPKTGKYFAFQVIEIKGDSTIYLLLDYFEERRPEESDLKKMAPFVSNRWFWDNAIDYKHANTKDFPKDATLVGNIRPIVTRECKTYGGWTNGYDFLGEAEWMTFPEETRMRFKKGQSDTSEIVVAGIKCRRSRQYIDDELLLAMTNYDKELYKLPVAYNFSATKYYPQLIPFLETRHTVARLEWDNHGQETLDLSRTHLRTITIWDEKMIEIKLPESCNLLTLNGKLHPALKVKAFDNGTGLRLEFNSAKQDDKIPDLGVSHLNGLTLHYVKKLDPSSIHKVYPHLHYVRLVGNPGDILNINSLGKLPELKSLMFEDIFGFTYEEFPKLSSWPKLKTLWLESIPEEAGKQIKKQFKGKVDDLDIRKLRKPEWMAENLDNPLRHWDGSEFVPRSKAKKAAQIYRDTRRSALAAAKEFLSDKNSAKLSAKLNEIAKEYVLAFNKLDGKTNFIETEEREDICAAFDVILDTVKAEVAGTGYEVNSSQLYDTMDEHRDW